MFCILLYLFVSVHFLKQRVIELRDENLRTKACKINTGFKAQMSSKSETLIKLGNGLISGK